MARNLGQTTCDRCGFTPTLIEEPRPITEEDCGIYFDEYEEMIVAKAECPECGALYLAWIDETNVAWANQQGSNFMPGPREPEEGLRFFDLSFRHSFNDEPGEGDLTPWTPSVVIRMDPKLARDLCRHLSVQSSVTARDASTAIEKALKEHHGE